MNLFVCAESEVNPGFKANQTISPSHHCGSSSSESTPSMEAICRNSFAPGRQLSDDARSGEHSHTQLHCSRALAARPCSFFVSCMAASPRRNCCLDGKSVTPIVADPKGEIHRTTYTDPATHLTVMADVRLYPDFPDAVDWVIRFRNDGSTDTPILENILPLDGSIPASNADCVLRHARGSDADANDFEPLEETFGRGRKRPHGVPRRRFVQYKHAAFFQSANRRSRPGWRHRLDWQLEGGLSICRRRQIHRA